MNPWNYTLYFPVHQHTGESLKRPTTLSSAMELIVDNGLKKLAIDIKNIIN